MPLKPVTLTPTGTLEPSLKPVWLEISRIANQNKTTRQPSDSTFLTEARAAIFRGTPVTDWPRELSEGFLALAARTVRDGNAPVSDATVELLLSFAHAAQVSESTRLEFASVWLLTQLRQQLSDSLAPDLAVAEATSHLSGLNLSSGALNRRIQTELVAQIASRLASGSLDDSQVGWARETCSVLLHFPDLRPYLTQAATAFGLGVSEPPPINDVPIDAADVGRDAPTAEAPSILPLPVQLSETDKLSSYGTIVFDLSAYAAEPSTRLSARTIDQVNKLDLDAPSPESNATLYFAAQDVWRGYVETGDRKLLTLVADLAQFLLSALALMEKTERANALHVWVAAAVARKIRTSSLPELLNDGNRVFVTVGLWRNDMWLRQGVVEAVAAECRAFELEGDRDARDQFLKENWTDLSSIHNEYLSRARNPRHEPRPEEQLAWDYLSTFSSISKPPEPGIRNSPDFQKVINRGAADDLYQFAVSRSDEVQRALDGRLNVRLGLEHVLEPAGEIFDQNSRDKGSLHPLFVEGKKALQQGEYAKAGILFERLSQRLTGVSTSIAKDYQGYALAKQGGRMPARLPLQEICEDGYTHPLAYWNLACCILSEEMDQQLEVLATGLKTAPHPLLLHGCVYLASFLGDSRRLKEWLPCLTFTEALLLYYKLDHEQNELTPTERRLHVSRLARYALEGEPIVPDIASARVPDSDIQRYLNSLLERQQPEAFEFWLRCREVRFRMQSKHWEIKADFFEKTERKPEAVRAFEEELRQRLRYFGILQGRNDKNRFRILRETAARLEKWLTVCMTPDLKSAGFRLYNTSKQFESQYSAILLPNKPRIVQYYGGDGLPNPPPPPPPPVDLGQLLVEVGAELQSRFKVLGDLPALRFKIDDLIQGLGRAGDRESAEALRRLVQLLEGYSRLNEEAERRAALQKLQTAFADLRRETQRELTESQSTLAGPVLSALKRVNDGVARDSKLLPDIGLASIDEEPIKIDPQARIVFPVRVSVTKGDGTAKVTNASGIIDDGSVELALRDKLGDLGPVIVGPGRSAILTFEAPPNSAALTPSEAKVAVDFEHSGGTYRTATVSIAMSSQSSPALPPSPFIYNRALEPDEIDGHFFGRREEQETILSSIRNGQQNLRYVEGIRRAGKSSLLRSVEREIQKQSLPLLPVYLSAGGISGLDHAGRLFFNLASEICGTSHVKSSGVQCPPEQRCCDNLPNTYAQFGRELVEKVSAGRVVVLLDDFNQLVDTAADAKENNAVLHTSIIGLLNVIWSNANPRAGLLWVFAGHKTLQQYKKDLPGADLWGTLKPIAIDFLNVDAVGEIIRTPLSGSSVVIPDETIDRVHAVTAGHPELVQKIGELMLNQARDERRCVLTPTDADEAARYLALYSDDPFAGAWVPEADLRKEPERLRLLAEFVRKVDVGGRTDLHKLLAPSEATDKHRAAIEDLKARKILHSFDDGLGVRARVLDLWLHHRMMKDVQFDEPGSPAVFVDVANLTSGKGTATLVDLDTAAGEGLAGRFALATVLDRIEKYVYDLTKVPIATKWAVNYPPRCAAVMECASKDYKIDHIPEDLFRKAQLQKGADDTILQDRIGVIEQQYPNVQHFIVVTGDKDYRVKISRLLERGKYVHVVSRASALGNPDTKYSYDTLAKKYPERFTLVRLEELLEKQA